MEEGMLFTIISTAVLVFVSIVLWRMTTSGKEPAPRARKAPPPESGPWDAGNNRRHGAR
jgi:hypothetical protein